MGHKYVATHKWCPIYYLQMIVSCFEGPMWWKHNIYSLFLKLMRKHLDKKLIYQSLRCFSVAIWVGRSMRIFHALSLSDMWWVPESIWDYLRWLVEIKGSFFSFIKDHIWRLINAWRGPSLSKAGKEVMIKFVIQSIPSYIISIYLMPNSVIYDIENMVNAFWWGGRSNNREIKCMAWKRVAYPKEFGWMGFRNFKAFNLAMAAKQGWGFLFKPESLVARVF